MLQSNDEPKKGHKKFYDLVVISCTVTMLGLQRNLTFNQVSWKDLRLRGRGWRRFGKLCVPPEKSWPRPWVVYLYICRYLLYSDLISCLTNLRNSLNVRLRASDGRAFSFFHNLFFFLILLRISLEIHMKINLPLFHSKGWIHISATASNKSLTLSVQMSTSSSKKAQFHGMYFSSSFSSVKFSLLKL